MSARRSRAAGASGLLIAAALGACSDRSGRPQVVEFWAMGREGEVVTALTREFEIANPGVRVDVQQVPWEAAHEKLLTAFVGETTPDIAQIGNTWIPELATLGALEGLDARVKASEIVQPDDFFPGIWATNVVDAHLVGIPWYVDTRLLFYRRDLLAQAGFARPPSSWSEWRQMMAALKERGGPDKYAVLFPINEFEPLLLLGLQQGEPLLREGGRFGNFRSPGFRRALRYYADTFEGDLAPRLSNTQISNVWDEFARGYFAFYITGPWNIGEFKRRLPAALQGSWMTAPMPGPSGPGASNAGGSSLVVFAGSPRKDAAWKLVEFLSRPDVQRRFYALSGNLPPRRSSWEDPSLRADPYAAAFQQQLERVEPTPAVPEWHRIAVQLRVVGEQLAAGRISVDEAAAELDARADEILEKRRWILDRQGAR